MTDATAGARGRGEWELRDDNADVTVSRIGTPCGTRIEVRSDEGDEWIRLGALELESLTWQAPGELLSRATPPIPEGYQVTDREEWTVRGDTVRVSNEFAVVTLALLERDGRDALRVVSPKLGYETALTPVELAVVSRSDMDAFSAFLETPFGPTSENTHH